MIIDRERLRIDLLTSVVGLGMATGLEGWAWWATPGAERVGAGVVWVWVWQLAAVLVGPQLLQTVVGQMVFTRLSLNSWVRGLVIVGVWFGALYVFYSAELVSLVMLPPWGLALAGVVPLALTRLAVLAASWFCGSPVRVGARPNRPAVAPGSAGDGPPTGLRPGGRRTPRAGASPADR